MLVTANGFSVLLQALGLSQGLSKPNPGAVELKGWPDVNRTTLTSANSFSPAATDPTLGDASNLQAQRTSMSASQVLDQTDSSCFIEPYSSPTPLEQTFPPFDEATANVYRYRQQQSVNLGSWFVQEKWMVPSLFTCASGSQASELDIATGWGSPAGARAVLERHWDTFINQSDFEYLAGIGINTVRLPIGYWSLGPYYCEGTPFEGVADVYQNAWSRVVGAINMAGEAGIGVLVDLHGAIGSQNGQPHSGISDGDTGLFNNPSHMDKTINALGFLMQQLVNVTNVVGIQILNEPHNVPDLPDFYTRAIESMRQISPAAATFPIYLHDGFDLERFSRYVASRTDFVVQDHHSYFVYTASDEAEPASQHTADIETAVTESLSNASAQQRRNLVVDEWSCALTPTSLSQEADPEQSRKEFCTGQMEVYANTTAGWSFWSYKKEQCHDDPGWCFKAAVGRSLPNSFFSFGQPSTINPAQVQDLTRTVGQMVLPSTSEILAKSQASPFWDKGRDRLAVPHIRRQSPPATAVLYDGIEMTTTQRSVSKGYSDGFLTAKIFATYETSKLGFVGQYIEDSIKALGPAMIEAGTEETYRKWFRNGLEDGQQIVVYAVSL